MEIFMKGIGKMIKGKDKEIIHINLEKLFKVIGEMIGLMDQYYLYLVQMKNMKDNLVKD